MWNNYWTFLDYLELRRRIEHKLASSGFLLLHTAAFLSTITVLVMTRAPQWGYFIEPGAGQITAIWSAALGLHGLWTFARSGAFGGLRERAIEQEMRERALSEDTYLSNNPKDLFRIHGILENDIAKRSSIISTLTTYSVINALLWIVWALGGASDSFAWVVTPFIGLFLLLPVLAFNTFRRERNEHKLREQMQAMSAEQPRRVAKEKLKRYAEDEMVSHAQMRLSDDGELMIEDDFDTPKNKRRE